MGRMGAIAALAALLLTTASVQAQAPDQVEPGIVKGMVRDAAGKPIEGAIVFIDGNYDNNLQQTTKADGAFRMRLPLGAFRAMAWFYKSYEGQKFKVDLKPDTTDTFDDAGGAVRNFTWALTGEKVPPDMGSFGAFMYVSLGTDFTYIEDQDNITYTLTPVGPLIDGSEGQVIVRKGGAPRTAEYGKILDIPVGHYTIKGVYAPPGKKPQTLKFQNAWGRGERPFVEELDFVIQAEGNYCSNCASVNVESLKEAEPL